MGEEASCDPVRADFYMGGQVVGFFKDRSPPTAEGTYPYEPYRGPGHLNLQKQLQSSRMPRCFYNTTDERVSFSTVEAGLRIHKYWSSACPRCPIRARCTPAPFRRITRWEHEHVLEAMQGRLDHAPEASKVRRRTVEHPFATLKAWMGATHFLTKTLPKVRTEMSLHVLAYNMKRAMNLLGTGALLRAITA